MIENLQNGSSELKIYKIKFESISTPQYFFPRIFFLRLQDPPSCFITLQSSTFYKLFGFLPVDRGRYYVYELTGILAARF